MFWFVNKLTQDPMNGVCQQDQSTGNVCGNPIHIDKGNTRGKQTIWSGLLFVLRKRSLGRI